MTEDGGPQDRLTSVSRQTPDPERAERNLHSLFEGLEEDKAALFTGYTKEIALLFASSQFLSNFSVNSPDWLLGSLGGLKTPLAKDFLANRALSDLALPEGCEQAEMMRALRQFKKRCLLSSTLRYLTGETGIMGSMDELTALAEVVLEASLKWAQEAVRQRFGDPSDGGRMALIGVGKLGGEELNYSSDVDLMAVYADGQGETSGVLAPSGVRMNRVTDHEFHAKAVEALGRLLSTNTEDGIAYRVDLRLRPQGRKGEIALPLASYREYYRDWGRTWERMMLIRARPVAGDAALGAEFVEAVHPFVWRRTVDLSEIEEIRALKKRIDTIYSRLDIKRGYGGLREAEFFVQTFQLLYGAEEKALRTHGLFSAVQALRRMGIIPDKDLAAMWENYLHLRKVEHFLQMKDDLQTHTLPGEARETETLGRQMGFDSAGEFLRDLSIRRMQTRNMYNSLLGAEEDVHAEALSLLEGDLSDEELSGYLSFRGLRDIGPALGNMRSLREQVAAFATQTRRDLTRRVIPELLEKALRAESPDRALSGLESFLTAAGMEDAQLAAFAELKPLKEGIIRIFSLSSYLTRIFLSESRYLGLLIEESTIRKTLRKVEAELERYARGTGALALCGEYKRAEEVRLGLYFLSGVITVQNLMRYLSHSAEAVTRRVCTLAGAVREGFPFSVMALGKLGGREMTYGSDLDIVFLSESPDGPDAAERVTKALASYTDRGMLYRVDARLRPDGSRGVLVNSLEGFRDYYMKGAQNWEIQALLKARPVAGDRALARRFMEMAREIAAARGPRIDRGEIAAMRDRIVRELSQERDPGALDIKLGRGGIEEIEFHVQWLQLSNAARAPEVLVQNTGAALHRLARAGVWDGGKVSLLLDAYEFFRRIETFQRLNDDRPLRQDEEFTALAASFMGLRSAGDLIARIDELRAGVLRAAGT